ncbi:hypothetical protein NQ318_002330 [Aromia moschata]|uniref:Protein takeout n=1 Tax=Aromia moschata TaxID=1265417 RepID=A0AAV8Z392_9CUCU|nr:hypothetical protein NQ318_002330 [Aromia moschata]
MDPRVAIIVALSVAISSFATVDAAKLHFLSHKERDGEASNFGRCSKRDPKFDECITKNLEDAIHKLKDGSSELGLRRFEPLDIPELLIGEGKGPVNVAQHFKNVRLHGLTGSKALESSIDFDNNILRAKSITPELILEADYTMKGRVLLLPIVGDGPCNVTLINTKINHTIINERIEKKGKTYWNVKQYTVTLRPEKVIFKFDNLFDGDVRLGNEINKVLNDNWDEVFTDVRDGYESSFGLIFHSLADRVFSKVALKDIFLD